MELFELFEPTNPFSNLVPFTLVYFPRLSRAKFGLALLPSFLLTYNKSFETVNDDEEYILKNRQ